MKYGILNPCMDCADRHEGCHGTCGRYREYRSHIGAIHAEKARQNTVDGYCIDTYKKIASYLRKKEERRKSDRR